MAVYLVKGKTISDILQEEDELTKLLNEGKILGMGKNLFYISDSKLVPYSKKIDKAYLQREKEKEGLSLKCESLELWAKLGLLETQFQKIIELSEQ